MKKIKSTRPPKRWTYYSIEYRTEQSGDVWYPIENKYFGLTAYEFGQHTACGDCWQITGDYGIFDKDYAMTFLKDLQNALTENKLIMSHTTDKIAQFRLVKIEKTIKKTLIEI